MDFRSRTCGRSRSGRPLLRIVSTGAALTAAEAVIKDSQTYVITTTPDYTPALAVKTTVNGKAFTIPVLRFCVRTTSRPMVMQ